MSTMAERAAEAGIPIHTLDLENDERLGKDPFAVWDEATETAPLFYSPAGRGFLVAADYDTVKSVLQNPKFWSNLPSTITYTKEEVVMDVPPISMDPPQHTAYRKALIPLFSPKAVAPMEPRIREIAHELCDAVEASTECDFMRDFAGGLPAQFFLEWLGLSGGDVRRMYELAQAATFDFGTQEQRDQIEHEINTIVGDSIQQRREHPEDDLATAFTEIRIDGEPPDEKLLVGMATLAFIAGQETTSSQFGWMIWHLARHPEDRKLLVDDPELIPDAIEELMRVYNTGGSSGRIAAQDGELGGYAVKKGDRMFLARCGADRATDHEVQLNRTPNRHSAFGLGVHRCLGSHVARLEMRIGLEVWHERFPEYRVADGFVPDFRYGAFMQQLKTLPLAFG